MDAKRIAMVIAITALLPLFLGLFVDAIYQEPKYDAYCNMTIYPVYKEPTPYVNCTTHFSQEYQNCMNSKGNPVFDYDENNCQAFKQCDYCNLNYDTARQNYNRNTFLILAPIGLALIIIGLYLAIEYIGVGLMLGSLITLFYATIRYFSDMSKLMRALIVLAELLIIIWIGYKKIEGGKKTENAKKKKKRGRV